MIKHQHLFKCFFKTKVRTKTKYAYTKVKEKLSRIQIGSVKPK